MQIQATSSNQALNEMAPTKDANDFRYHRLERDNQYSDLQVRFRKFWLSFFL